MKMFLVVAPEIDGEDMSGFVVADTPSEAAELFRNDYGLDKDRVRVFTVPQAYGWDKGIVPWTKLEVVLA